MAKIALWTQFLNQLVEWEILVRVGADGDFALACQQFLKRWIA